MDEWPLNCERQSHLAKDAGELRVYRSDWWAVQGIGYNLLDYLRFLPLLWTFPLYSRRRRSLHVTPPPSLRRVRPVTVGAGRRRRRPTRAAETPSRSRSSRRVGRKPGLYCPRLDDGGSWGFSDGPGVVSLWGEGRWGPGGPAPASGGRRNGPSPA